MAKAYVLTQTRAGKTGSALAALRASGKVSSADAVTGLYDIIAVVEAEDMEGIGRVVTEEIHAVEGVERTLTCVVVGIG